MKRFLTPVTQTTTIIVALFFLLMINVSLAYAQEPTYGGGITIDGSSSDWDLTTDFFANMHEAGRDSKDVLSKLYLRYDCTSEVLYLLVVIEEGHAFDPSTAGNHWVKLTSQGNGTIVDDTSGDDGTPPDFSLLTLVDPNAEGWEASIPLAKNTTDQISVHTQVRTSGVAGGRTSATTPDDEASNRHIDINTVCTDPEPEIGSLEVTKVVEWNGVTPDEQQTFEICISGPSYPNGGENGACQEADYDGETLTWNDLDLGEYTVIETDPGSEWTVGISGSSATVEAGQTAEVTVTNTRDAPNSITIVKDVIGDNANTAQAFQISYNSSAPVFIPPGSTSISEDDGAVERFTNVRNNLLVQLREENIPQDWAFVSLECVSETGQTSFSYPAAQDGREVLFAIREGDNVTCTWTNEYTAPKGTIVIEKVTTNDDDATEFTFNPSGFNNDESFTLVGGGEQLFEVEVGNGYSVEEVIPDGWSLDSATCDDGSPVENIDVSADETVTCTFTNTKEPEPGSLTIVKEATPEDGTDFIFAASGPGLPAPTTEPPTFAINWGTQGSGAGQFSFPRGVAVDGQGNVYVADTNNDRIQKFTKNGIFLTQWGTLGNGDGQFSRPVDVVVDSNGHVYVVDSINSRIQKFDSSGTFLSQWGSEGNGDGQFLDPQGVAVDGSGNVYVADTRNNRIQKFDSNGTFLSKWDSEGDGDGQFRNPQGVAVDGSGNVYVADTRNDRIQTFDSSGTFLSKWGTRGNGDGQFSFPTDITVDGSGNVYVTDTSNHRIQTFDSSGTFLTQWGTWGIRDGQLLSPQGVALDDNGNVYVADSENQRIQKFALVGFTLDDANPDDNDSVAQSITFPDLEVGDYSITELVPTGWQLDQVRCEGGKSVLDGETLTVAVFAGEDVVCTFENSVIPPSSLTIIKESTPANGTDFTFTANGPSLPPTFITKWGSEGSGAGEFTFPAGIAVDGNGNVYVTDTQNDRIQKFDSSGIFLTQWGTHGTGDGEFNFPDGLAVDGNGNVYVTDRNNNRIQKFDSNGTFLLKWGTRGSGAGQLKVPQGVAVDDSGNVYVTDTFNDRIQKFDSNGIFLTQWGTRGSGAGQFSFPDGLTVDSHGNVYVADVINHRIQKFDSSGTFLTQWGTRGNAAGQFWNSRDVAVDDNGNVYVIDSFNDRIQMFDSNGTFLLKWGTEGTGDGQFQNFEGVTVDSTGNLYVADSGNNRIQTFTPVQFMLDDEATQPNDSVAQSMTFNDLGAGIYSISEVLPEGWDLDSVVCDTEARNYTAIDDGVMIDLPIGADITCILNNSKDLTTGSLTIVKKADPADGTDFTFAASGPGLTTTEPPVFITQWGKNGNGDGQFQGPTGVDVDSNGNIYVADFENDNVQKFDSNGGFIARWGTSGSGDGQFSNPFGVAVDGSGNVYVADTDNHRIQKFDSNGTFITQWGNEGNGDGQFKQPEGLVVDGSGNVYVADASNHRIQKFDSNGTFITQWGTEGSGDGQFWTPSDIAVDSNDNVYVTDRNNNRIQKFNSNGAFITQWGTIGTGDGEFVNPAGVAIDSGDNVYVADTGNDRIQKFDSNGTFITQWGTEGSSEGQFDSPFGVAVDDNGNIYVSDSQNDNVQKFAPVGFTLDDEANQPNDSVSQSVTFNDLADGEYTITERVPTGWQLDQASCESGKYILDEETLTVAVVTGENIVCTFENSEIPPSSLTIIKEASPEDGTDFTFFANGASLLPAFQLKWGSEGEGEGQFSNPFGVAVDGSGNVYVADRDNNRIQKFDSSGGFITAWGTNGSSEGQFNGPQGVAVDGSGNVYVADTDNDRIQKFDSSGGFITAWGTNGSGEGQFLNPLDIAVDSNGNVYVTDVLNSRIQAFDSSGGFITQWGTNGSGEGEFNFPTSIAMDGSSNIYVVDSGNDRIQTFDSSGSFITAWGTNGSSEGQFNRPFGVAVDSNGNVYVTDVLNSRIQMFDSSGGFITQWGASGTGDGVFDFPASVTADENGDIYVVDSNNNRIQKFVSVQFTLDDEDTQPNDSVAQSITLTDLMAGNYSISEILPEGWQLDQASCVGGSDAGSLSGETLAVTIGVGEDVVCTFENSKPATAKITIVKTANPSDTNEQFSFTGDLGNFSLEANGSEKFEVAAGSYTVTEIDIPEFWTLLTVQCDDQFLPITNSLDLLGRQVSIEVEANEELTCTFHNERVNYEAPVDDDKGNKLYLPIVVK